MDQDEKKKLQDFKDSLESLFCGWSCMTVVGYVHYFGSMQWNSKWEAEDRQYDTKTHL